MRGARKEGDKVKAYGIASSSPSRAGVLNCVFCLNFGAEGGEGKKERREAEGCEETHFRSLFRSIGAIFGII